MGSEGRSASRKSDVGSAASSGIERSGTKSLDRGDEAFKAQRKEGRIRTKGRAMIFCATREEEGEPALSQFLCIFLHWFPNENVPP